MTLKKLNLHLVSDSSGETVISVAKSALKHFRSIETVEYVWSFVKEEEQIDKILEEINKKSNEHNFVICTITNDKLRKYLKDNCVKLKIPYRAILSHIMREISSYLEIEKDEKFDLHTEINNEYFQRIEAINYTINHDDGQNIQDIDKSDIILIGVSRTSKSPTSMYLAYRGYKVANIPFVGEIPFYFDLAKLKDKLTIGLTIDVNRLVEIRKNRLTSINNEDNSIYADPKKVEKEIKKAEELFKQNNWPIIDVTQKSIEEVSATIIQYFNRM
ncbi:kinase/pyrophosphorylase [Wolbachia endosymbiont of Brugia malayi]|uniref:Putative pyruvate, phosphate dikinase regulatory protein n=1 Tax=Wolbachia sp. subsp. Brugia malayi (strain TRS) TaxID=292805 RepID=PDRP_WOLTR|nr:pyruvate, water dikinase regulatory protein [Wolbachia endosymbiont of Brugia malayi]Q5GS03.1 RecName: Full=Putative pyruvate, phosphate dikinase regulatory protein; Short=PPDK regulatory protein [Wolbachia endosymbiont strain TRS of Brugia malayi]AAW71221.1 Predicted nucleotide kinase, YdiA family [Wolbachia endosymbiont strain TRS of Brugia malayi]QCB61415.1 kinase/pyrophosphorylase [Wolbachia endosymbiont of Brugia malayi]